MGSFERSEVINPVTAVKPHVKMAGTRPGIILFNINTIKSPKHAITPKNSI